MSFFLLFRGNSATKRQGYSLFTFFAESMSCGTPVVCFDATGPKDIVDHKINGYKANPFDTSDLAAGINWVLSDNSRHKELCINAREKAVACFDIEKVAGQYAELYMEAIRM